MIDLGQAVVDGEFTKEEQKKVWTKAYLFYSTTSEGRNILFYDLINRREVSAISPTFVSEERYLRIGETFFFTISLIELSI